MPRGGYRGGVRPREWIHNTDKYKHLTVPPEIADAIKFAAKLIDKGDPEILELLKRKQLES